ncbi:DISP3, partial [Symbiodinium sp. CCMP2456]
IGFLFVACILVAGYVALGSCANLALAPVQESRRASPNAYGPVALGSDEPKSQGSRPMFMPASVAFLEALPCSFGLLGLSSAGFAVNVNLDFSDYLRAELEEQYLLDAADEAQDGGPPAEITRMEGGAGSESDEERRGESCREHGPFLKGWTVYDYEQRQRSNGSMEACALTAPQPQTLALGVGCKGCKSRRRLLLGLTSVTSGLAYQIWELDIFYQAVDPSTGIFTEEALKEIKDFEDQLVSFDGYGDFCRRWHDRGSSCDVPYSVKNLFYSVPNASLHNGSTMSLAYDGSGTLADIESVLKELLNNEIRWWTDGDFNRNNLKSQYSRATLYGGAPLPGYSSWDDRRAEQEAKINAWLGRLFEEFLRRADLTGDDALPYKHVKFTWYERRINNYEILYYLRFDTLFALGTMATVALLVLARIQNLFITFFGAIGVALAFVGTYYFHFVVAGFKALSILDFVSLFVILGIAADDVLLLFNTYSLAAVLLGAEATPQQKMRWAYKEGTAPMLVTTVTTCGSFYANCFSIVTHQFFGVLKIFGFFMATLVAWNFLNVLIIFPAAILVNDLYIIPLLTCRRDHVAQATQSVALLSMDAKQCMSDGCPGKRASNAAIQSKQRLLVKGVTDVKHQDLGLVERVVAKRFSPCLYHSRCLLILLSIVAAGVFCYLATVAFHVSEGQIKIFEEDLNLGRLEELRKEVFPATSDEDFKEAIRAAPPDRATDVRSCPGRTVGDGNTSWCSGQGTCDATSSTCSCDEGVVGQGCSVTRSSGTLDLVYLSIAQDPESEYLYAHVLSSPELLAAPDALPLGRGDFFLRNQGDEDVDWQLDREVPAWLSFEPTGGVLQKRSFSRTDDSFAGRSSFQAAFDLAGKTSGWSEQMELRLLATTPSASLPPRSLRITAAVASPPALGALKAFAEGEEVSLQPAFDVSRGFGTDPSENFVSRNLEIRYQVFSRSDWLRVDLEALGPDSVLVSGRPLRGTSLGISAPGSIEIQVISSFSRQTTTYFLEAFRSCDGPCPTETSTTATTTRITSTLVPGVSSTTTTHTTTQTQDTDHLVGLMTLAALNCPALRSQEGKSRLEFGLAQIAQVEEAVVSVSVWCDGRRLSSSRQLQVSPVELLYSMVVVGGGIATADVVRRLDLESPETMTQKLQASLDADGFPVVLEVLSLEAIQVNPDPTTTATSSTWTFTPSTGTATATTSTATTTSVTVSATTSLTATSATETSTTSSTSKSGTSTRTTSTSSSISRTSSTVSQTSSTYTSVTSTWTRSSTTTLTFTTATNTITFADGFGYIFGEARLAECISAGSAAREPELLEALAEGIASLAEVEASLVEPRLCPEQARRLQAASPRLEYGIHIPSERGLELFPRAFAALQAASAASLQAALNAALRDQGFVGSNLTVEDASVFSGAPPTTRTSSTATSTTTTTTILCPGNPVCSGSGSCVQQETGDWACECRETFAGEDCAIRECPTCANNASCLEGAQDLEAVWECDCIEPYYGPRCEEKGCPGNCTNAGDCDAATGLCSCFAGSLGEDCAQREVPLTNAIEIAIVFGLLGYEDDNRSAPAYDGSVDLLSPAVQAHMLRTCTEARADAGLLVKSELSCWIESFAEFMPLVGGAFPVNDSDMVREAFQAFMHQNVASLNSFLAESYQKDVRTAGEDFAAGWPESGHADVVTKSTAQAGRVMFSRLRMKVNMAVNAAKEQKDVVRQRWQDFVASLNQRAPPEAGQAMMVSWVWTSMALEESVFSSTILAFSLSLSTSMVAVALFTRDILLAFYVCLNILLVVSVLSGFLLNVLDYDFGVVEAIGATIFVGLSVDYCLHLAHGYHTASGRQAKVRVHHALVMLTPTILGGALTTIAGCAFLLPCRILLFRKLGWTLMLNAIIAITYTFTFLAPLLMIAGPVKRSPGAVRAGYADGDSPTDSFAAVTSRFVQREVVPESTCIGKAERTPEEGPAGNLRKSAESASSSLHSQICGSFAAQAQEGSCGSLILLEDRTLGVVFEGPGQGGAGGFLRPLEVVRGTAEASRRLQSVEEQLKSASATFWERVQLASVLDLGRRHREAAEQLSLAEAEHGAQVPSSQKAAAALLGAMVQRHLRWEEQRHRLRSCGQRQRRSAALDLEILPGSSTREELRSFLVPGMERPFVLRGFQTPRWAPEDLREILGHRRVPIRRCEDASANWAALEFVSAVPFSDFYDAHVLPYLAEGVLAPRDSPQLFDHSIWQHCEDTHIGRELLMPSQVFPKDLYTSASAEVHPVTGSAGPTLFLAAQGTGSSLHVDTLQTHFWMMLCHGQKRWRLVSAEDLCLLRPLYLTDLNPVFPKDLDAFEAEEEEEEDYAFVSVSEVLLEPGDFLFVPAGWPHQVENLKTSVAVSANFVDESNLERALEEAEILGLVEETPQLLGAALRRRSEAAAEAEEAPSPSETLRGFKARHGEPRAPREVQQLLKRGFSAFVGFVAAEQGRADAGPRGVGSCAWAEAQEVLAEGLLMVDRASKAKGEEADPEGPGGPRGRVAVQKQLGDLLPGYASLGDFCQHLGYLRHPTSGGFVPDENVSSRLKESRCTVGSDTGGLFTNGGLVWAIRLCLRHLQALRLTGLKPLRYDFPQRRSWQWCEALIALALGQGQSVDASLCWPRPSSGSALHGRLSFSRLRAKAQTQRADAWLQPGRALKALGSWTNRAVSAVGSFVVREANVPLADLSGVERDRAGGLSALVGALLGHSVCVAFLMEHVEAARRANPLIYEGNLDRCKVPFGSRELLQERFGWLRAALQLTTEEVEVAAGLDAAMLVEFMDLAMWILAVVGLPLICILCPLHYFCGAVVQEDKLSSIGMANVEHGSWLCWLHSGIVWFVVLVVEKAVAMAQGAFAVRRVQWLRSMPAPRSRTLLVEHIPPEFCSNDSLSAYFNSVFGREVVETAHVTRNTQALRALLSSVQLAEAQLQEGEVYLQKTGRRPTMMRPRSVQDFTLDGPVRGELRDVIDHWSEVLQTERSALLAEQRRLGLKDAAEPDFIRAYCTSAFVTFWSRRDAEIALRVQYRADGLQFLVSSAPAPDDVRHQDLQKGGAVWGDMLMGYLCILFLFWVFAPFVVAFSAVAQLETLETVVPSLHHIVTYWPLFRSLWDGLASAFALALFMSCLPFCLYVVCSRLFVTKSERRCQLRVQSWYFFFLAVFVLLVPAVGSSVFYTMSRLVDHPKEIFSLLASTLPYSTHFYLSYFPLQWTFQVLEAARYPIAMKYLAMKALYGEDQAKTLCEPEDQAYYGIGARSARCSLLLSMALTFCSLSPLICALGLATFGLCRLTYGYLLVYSETTKPDLGGEFWCLQLQHLQKGLFLYVALMTSVLLERSDSLGPPGIAAGAGVLLLQQYLQFKRKYQWRCLPFEDLVHVDDDRASVAVTGVEYQQPELRET